MPSRKRRRREVEVYDEAVGESPGESIFSILAEGLAAGIVKTFTAEAQKVAEAFVARQQATAAVQQETPPPVVVEGQVVDNATTEHPEEGDVIEGEFRHVE